MSTTANAIVSSTGFGVVTALVEAGTLDLGQFVAWCKTATTLDLANVDHITALLAIVSRDDYREIVAARQSVKPGGKPKLRCTISAKGLVSLQGITSTKVDGFAPSYRPRVLSGLLAQLPMLLQFVVDNADSIVSPAAMVSVNNPAIDDLRESGLSGEPLKAAVKAQGLKWADEAPHPRRGQSALDWSGCDKASVVAQCKAMLAKLA